MDYYYHKKEFPKIKEYESDPIRKEAKKWWAIQHKYGIDKDEWYWMLKEQAFRCKICTKVMSFEWAYDPRWKRMRTEICVDHDHKTDKVRGLLCQSCNTLIGQAKDDVSILNSAIVYLEEYGK